MYTWYLSNQRVIFIISIYSLCTVKVLIFFVIQGKWQNMRKKASMRVFFPSCRSFRFYSHPVNHLHLHSLWARSVTHSMTLPSGSFGLIYNRGQCFGFPQLVATYFDIATPFHGSLLLSITEYLALCLHMTYKHTNGVFTNSLPIGAYLVWLGALYTAFKKKKTFND